LFHGVLQSKLVSRIQCALTPQFVLASGEVGFRDTLTEVDRSADILVTEKGAAMLGTILAHPPILLIEIMSPYDLPTKNAQKPTKGSDELEQNLTNVFDDNVHPCRAAWVVYHKNIVGKITTKHGVEVHNGKYEPKPKLYVGNEILPDGGVGLNFTASSVLKDREE